MFYRNKHQLKSQKGFTLMELMITVAVIGIISAIAIPSYTKYVIRAKRADAKVALMGIAQKQESYFVQNMSYAAAILASGAPLGNLGYAGATVESEQNLYTIRVDALDFAGTACTGLNADACTSYTLTADAINTASQGRDTLCTSFRIDNLGRKIALGSGPGTAVYVNPPTAALIAKGKECWGR